MKLKSEIDPKGLIGDAFAIADIAESECRSIFLDWALSLPAGHDPKQAVVDLIDEFGAQAPAEHPMFAVLRAALSHAPTPRRRGGRSARIS